METWNKILPVSKNSYPTVYRSNSIAILFDQSSCSLGVFPFTSLFTRFSQRDPLLARDAGPIPYTATLCLAGLGVPWYGHASRYRANYVSQIHALHTGIQTHNLLLAHWGYFVPHLCSLDSSGKTHYWHVTQVQSRIPPRFT